MNENMDHALDIIGIDITTKLFHQLSEAFIGGHDMVRLAALKLIAVLMGIDLLMAMLMHRDDGEQIKTLISKVLRYGFFFWIVNDFQWIVNEVLLGFKLAGSLAGSYSGGISDELLADPALLISYGLGQSTTYLNGIFKMVGTGGSATLANQPLVLGGLFIWMAIVYAFINVAMTIIITLLEFYMTATLALMLIPFGVYEKLAHIGENALKAIIGQGVRVMVVTFIASVVVPVMRNWKFDFGIQNGQYAVTMQEGLYLLMAAKVIEKVIATAPEIARSLISGAATGTGGWGGNGEQRLNSMAAGMMGGGIGALASQMRFGGGGGSSNSAMSSAVKSVHNQGNSVPDSGGNGGSVGGPSNEPLATPTVSQVHNRMENASGGNAANSNNSGNVMANLPKSPDSVNAKMAPANNEQPPKLT